MANNDNLSTRERELMLDIRQIQFADHQIQVADGRIQFAIRQTQAADRRIQIAIRQIQVAPSDSICYSPDSSC